MKCALEIEGEKAELINKLELALFHPNHKKGECVPEELETGKFYKFNLKGWKIFPFKTPIHLFGGGSSFPLAVIEITSQEAYLLAGSIYTQGEYFIKNYRK